MRTISTAQAASRDSVVRAERVRVEILQGATWRDMTTLAGVSWLSAVTITDDVDSSFATAEITLRREVGEWSLSPYMNTSGINRQFLFNGTLVPLIALNASVRISVDMTPPDWTGASSWLVLFQGHIFEFDGSAGDELIIQCRDQGGVLNDKFVEHEYQYGYRLLNASSVQEYRGVRAWEQETEYFVDGTYIASTNPIAGSYRWYRCISAGVTGATEPAWGTSGTTASGTAIFTYMGTLSGDSGLAGWSMEQVLSTILSYYASTVTLYVPSSPGVNLNPFPLERKLLMDALRDVARQIGWDVRYKWREATQQFELTLFEPPRTKTTPDFTFGADDIISVDGLKVTVGNIRNVVRVVYEDQSRRLPSGKWARRSVIKSDSASIAKYGRLYCELGESASNNINSSTEATKLANAVLADLCEPLAEMEVGMQLFPQVELGDLYRFTGNGKHFDGDTDLAVIGYSHEFQMGDSPSFRTRLTCRGKPSGGTKAWLVSEAIRSGTKIAKQTALVLTPTLVATPNAGTVTLKLSYGNGTTQAAANAWDEHDVYVGTSSSFTPDSITYKGTFKGDTFTVTGLVPGETYYAKVVSRTNDEGKVITSEASADAVTVQPARADAGHLNAAVRWGRQPLNGGFETHTNPLATAMPDHWTVAMVTSGTPIHGTDYSVFMNDGTAFSGMNFVRLHAVSLLNPVRITSGRFDVIPGKRYRFRMWLRYNSGAVVNTSDVYAGLNWYQHDGVSASLFTGSVGNTYCKVVGSWSEVNYVFTAPTTARSVEFFVGPSVGTGYTVDIDSVSVEEYEQKQNEWNAATLASGYANYNTAQFNGAEYMLDSLGFVNLRGMVWRNSGSGLGVGTAPGNTVIFNLPVGFRPAKQQVFKVYNDGMTGLVCTIDVFSNGDVAIGNGGATNNATSLDMIRFQAGG